MIGAVLLAAAAVLVALVAVLAAVGRLQRNPIAGIRIASLYASSIAWREGHRAAVLPTAAAALICIVVAVVACVDPDAAGAGVIVQTAVLVLGVLVGGLLADRAARGAG